MRTTRGRFGWETGGAEVIELQFPFPTVQSNSIIYKQRWNTAPSWRAILGSVSHGCTLLGLGYEEVSPEQSLMVATESMSSA